MGHRETPLDDRRRALLQDLARPAGLDRRHRLVRHHRRLQQAIDLGRRQLAAGAGIEHEIERVGRALGLPEAIGHDAHRVVPWACVVPGCCEPGSSLATCTAGRRTTARTPGSFRISASLRMVVSEPVKDGAERMAPYSMPGTTTSMPKTAVPVHLATRVETGERLADQRERGALLERRRCGERQFGGSGRERAVRQPLALRADHEALLGAALVGGDLPVIGGCSNQHVARLRAGGAQPAVEHGGRHRGAFLLDRRLVLEGDLVGVAAGDEAHLHALPVGIELVGQDLRQRGVGALPDLRLRQAERDLAVGRDHDPVGDLLVGRACGLCPRR